jgi:hypothetical protein
MAGAVLAMGRAGLEIGLPDHSLGWSGHGQSCVRRGLGWAGHGTVWPPHLLYLPWAGLVLSWVGHRLAMGWADQSMDWPGQG